MRLDLRLPIGLMFMTLGVLIGGFGLLTQASPLYAVHSLGINVDLWWGLVMIVFGSAMLTLAARARKRTKT